MTDDAFDALLTAALVKAVERELLQPISPAELEATPPISARFVRRMNRLYHSAVKKAANKKSALPRRILRYAAGVIIAAAITLGAVLIHPQTRATLIGLIRAWFDDHTEYRQSQASPLTGEWSADMPEGYTLSQETRTERRISYYYVNDITPSHYIFINIYSDSYMAYADNERAQVRQYYDNGDVIDVYESLDLSEVPNTLIWYDSARNITIRIQGYLSSDELISIAKSIRQK